MRRIRCAWVGCGLLGIILFQHGFGYSQDVALSTRQEAGPAQARSLASVLTELEAKFKVHFSFDSELIREK